MPVLRDIGLLARCLDQGPQDDVHPIPDAALVWEGDRIVWVGPGREVPPQFAEWPSESAGGRLVVPGLIDCHTHLAFGGWRGDEFAERIRGRTYQEIAAGGGGILSTVRHTREASEEDLLARAGGFLEEMTRLGVTTVEAKSGYGLDLDTELKQLAVYDALAEAGPQRIVSTLLAAHTVPEEYLGRREEYLRLVIDRILPTATSRTGVRFCDIFVEEGVFTSDDARALMGAARTSGLGVKLHVDQLHDGGGAALAAELGAVSADHLEHANPAGIAAMAAGGCVAVSLPIATLYLRQPPMPARAFLEAGVPVAVATDFNPGSAPSYHLPLAMTLACTLQRMTPAEVLRGVTSVAARALGMEREIGSLEVGKCADFAVIDAADPNQWLYHFRDNACARTVIAGRAHSGTG